MKLLLDTHVLLWALLDDPALPRAHAALLRDDSHDIHVSAATIWEIGIKRALGKLAVPEDFTDVIAQTGCAALPIRFAHAEAAASLPRHHGDPFDRMLIAQARVEGLTLLSADSAMRLYDVDVI